MFKITKSKHPALVSTSSNVGEAKRVKENLGYASASASPSPRVKDGKFVSTSAQYGTRVGVAPNTNLSGNVITVDTEPLLNGIVHDNSTHNRFAGIYRDMYMNDPVAGSTVDLMSFMPFGSFSLGGLAHESSSKQAKVYDTFYEVLERLNIRQYMPESSVDKLVLGEHISSFLYNPSTKKLLDIMPHRPEDCEVDPLPFYSQEPIITVKFPDEIKKVLGRTNSKRIKAIREHLGDSVIDKILQGTLELDPLMSIFLARRTYTTTGRGTSLFRRLLPIYLIEKNLFRGTIMESTRRQRGILHVTMGDGDQWIPINEEMQFMSDQFMSADADPLGSIIVTRPGISTEEIRQGGDFWKVQDFQDQVLSHKLRALQISEGFLSGDATYATADNALSVFLSLLMTHRQASEDDMLNNKLYPLISLINGFTINKDRKLSIQPDLMKNLGKEEALSRLNSSYNLFKPKTIWTKSLKPEGDTGYMEMMNSMTEKGVPVPIRVLAAAGGLNLDDLLEQQEEDLKLRKRLSEYTSKIAALVPKEGGEDGEGDENVSESSDNVERMASFSSLVRSSVLAKAGGRISILNRTFNEEPYTLSKTGKKKAIIGTSFDKKINRLISKAADARNKAEHERVRELRKKRKAK